MSASCPNTWQEKAQRKFMFEDFGNENSWGEREELCRRGRSRVLPPENFKRTSTVKHLFFGGGGGSDKQMRDYGRLKGPLSYQYQKEIVK